MFGLPQSLIDAAMKVLLESYQSNVGFTGNKSKISKEDKKELRERDVWKHYSNLHGSSMRLPTTPEDEMHIEPLFYREKDGKNDIDKAGWVGGVKEYTNSHPIISKTYTNEHFIHRAINPERNRVPLTGEDISAFKQRILNHINTHGLPKQPEWRNRREHLYISTTHPKTKGYKISVCITKNSNGGHDLNFTTFMPPEFNFSNTDLARTLIESYGFESIIEIE